MKILRLIAVFIFFGFLAAAASFCIYQSVVIGNAVAAIDSMGGAVRDEYDSLGAPVGVTLKLIGRNSSATDANVAKNIPALRGLTSVRMLSVGGTAVSDDGLNLLIDLWGTSLEYVDVSHSKVSEQGVAKILECPKLMHLVVSTEQLNESITQAFASRPNLEVTIKRAI